LYAETHRQYYLITSYAFGGDILLACYQELLAAADSLDSLSAAHRLVAACSSVMVKKRVGGAHRYSKVVQAATTPTEDAAGPKPPQHLQRKITKKVKFLEKVAKSNTALQVKKDATKKRTQKQLLNLHSLAGELELLAQQQQQQNKQTGKGKACSIKHQKQRLRTGVAESKRLQQVLHNPLFQADPFQALTNHLMNTLPAAPQPTRPQHQKQQGDKSKKRKMKGKGGAGSAMAMQS
jgi:hypothetical protein